MARVLVSEELADTGLERLRRAGHEVDVRTGLSPEQLREAIKGAQALIVRSATAVDAALLEAGADLVVVGRAGVGLDNVDVEAATRRGVMVANAPESNIVSAAEHTMAMLLSIARNVPQAHAALVQGRWERSRWEGVELLDKTLGIVGLGRIGKLVAQRAAAFGMRLIGYDPYVSADRARALGIELVDLDRLVAEADFLTVHLPKTKETVGLVDRELLLKAKPSLRVINVARGGIVDEAELAEAVRDGVIAGAALDVFDVEPTTESPLFGLSQVVVTPHLGASTREAQDKAGDTIAEMVGLALDNEFVPYAVNVSAGEVSETTKPFLALAERLGALFVALNEGVPEVLEIGCQGQIATADTRILTVAVLKGIFSRGSETPVSFVNAPLMAADRGVEVRESRSTTAVDYVNLLTIRGGHHSLAGTVAGLNGEQRLTRIDDNIVDIPPSLNMLYVRNEDRPGMIGKVGTILGESSVNIDDMDVGRDPNGAPSTMVVATDRPVPAAVVDRLRSTPGIVSVHVMNA